MKKGFIMIEVIIIITTVFIITGVLYLSIQNLLSLSNKTKEYDYVENLYNLNSLKVFLYNNTDVNTLVNNTDVDNIYNLIKTNKNFSTNNYELKFTLDENTNSFTYMLKDMEIINLFISKKSSDIINNSLISDDNKLKRYLKYLNMDTNNSGIYLLIAEFSDNTYASINMYEVSL